MLKISRHFTGLLALAILMCPATGIGAQLPCEILQYKHGRIYLGAGEDQNVYPGCGFVITDEKDTVYTGQIEFSYLGVSISRPTFGFSDTLEIEKYQATIETVSIDTSSRIEIACYGLDPYELIRPTNDILPYDSVLAGINVATTTAGNPVWLCRGEAFRLDWDFVNGIYDGSFASSMLPEPTNGNAEVLSSPAPFVAVLMPNLSKKTPGLAMVTTSMYYRFDVARLWPSFFQSEIPSPVHRLYISDEVGPRSYPYDAEKGRLLVSKNRDVPSKLKLSVENPRLVKVAEYFADILSRDKIRLEVRSNDSDADLFLTFIPVDFNDPVVSLWRITDLLQRQQPYNKADKEAVAIIENHLHSAQSATDVASSYHFYRLADRALQSDLGVFPLFRPTVYFLPGNDLKNVRFDESGYLDLSALTKIILPPTDWEN